MTTYKIIRFFFDHPNRVIKRGLTLEEAQRHCRHSDTSSRTASDAVLARVGRDLAPWFDGYDEE
jgi:hypothetical protein